VVRDQSVTDLHDLDDVHLISVRGFARVLPDDPYPVGEKARPVPATLGRDDVLDLFFGRVLDHVRSSSVVTSTDDPDTRSATLWPRANRVCDSVVP